MKEKVSVWLGLSGLLYKKPYAGTRKEYMLVRTELRAFFWLPSSLILLTLIYLGKHCEPHQHLPERDWPKERAAEVRL
jgi:hypothetical protein